MSVEIFFSLADVVEEQKQVWVHGCFLANAGQKLNYNLLERNHFFTFYFCKKIFPKRQLSSAWHFRQLLHKAQKDVNYISLTQVNYLTHVVDSQLDENTVELLAGFVVLLADHFSYLDFNSVDVAKDKILYTFEFRAIATNLK